MSTPIPLARGIPLLGSALPMLRDPLAFCRRHRQELGPVFRVKAGNRNMLILSGIEINRFMSEEGRDAFISRDFWGRLVERWQCPHFISAMDGPEHIEMRRTLKSTMTRQIVAGQQQLLIDVTTRTIDESLAGSETTSVRALTRTLTNRALMVVLTGATIPLEPEVANALAEYQRQTFNVLVLGKWPKAALYTPGYLYYKRVTERFIAKLRCATEREPPESGFYRVVLDNFADGTGISGADLDFMFLAPFWAGLDTLGASMVFLLQHLLHNPEHYDEARVALDEACAGQPAGWLPDVSELKQIPALYGLCMEVLRLYPVAFGNGRTVARSFDYAGYRIREGEDVLVFTTAQHFDEAWFAQPELFDTSRYQSPRNEHRRKYAFSPYGRGTHICLGAAMAESLFLLITAVIIRQYNISGDRRKRYPMIFDPSPTLSGRFRASFTPRRQGGA